MSNKKKLLKTIFTANAGCGCGRPNLSDVYEPSPILPNKSITSQKKENPTNYSCDYSSSSCDNNTSTTRSFNLDSATISQNSESETDPKSSKISDSVAVVKDSDDPFEDFKNSMLQMILEKEIYSKEDLHELLNCFLELNSTCHRDVIILAFTEIWNEVICKKIKSQKSCTEDDHQGGVSHK